MVLLRYTGSQAGRRGRGRHSKSVDYGKILEVENIEDSPQKESQNHRTVDDSGFGDGDESVIVLDNDYTFELDEFDHEVITVEDDAFDTIERSVETLLEEQNKYLEERYRSKKCLVQMYNFSVEYDGDDGEYEESMEEVTAGSPSVKAGKRGRP